MQCPSRHLTKNDPPLSECFICHSQANEKSYSHLYSLSSDFWAVEGAQSEIEMDECPPSGLEKICIFTYVYKASVIELNFVSQRMYYENAQNATIPKLPVPYLTRIGRRTTLFHTSSLDALGASVKNIVLATRLSCTSLPARQPTKLVSEMTYYVSSGTLNPTHSLSLLRYILGIIGRHQYWRQVPVIFRGLIFNAGPSSSYSYTRRRSRCRHRRRRRIRLRSIIDVESIREIICPILPTSRSDCKTSWGARRCRTVWRRGSFDTGGDTRNPATNPQQSTTHRNKWSLSWNDRWTGLWSSRPREIFVTYMDKYR